MINYNDHLRLEVEVPTEGLPNLVLNPTGEKGAWFWITPVANTNLTSSGSDLTFSTTVSQAARFTTDYMPVAATKYVSSRIDISAITAGHNVKVVYNWYDANKVSISTSTQSVALNTIGVNYGGTQQAPANTAYVKARFDFYNGTGNPAAAAEITFTNAMVTWQDTGSVSSIRENLIDNPSAEVDKNGWTTGSANYTVTRVTTQAFVGSACLQVKANTSGLSYMRTTFSGWDPNTPPTPVTPGKTYTVSVYTKAGSTARQFRLGYRLYNSSVSNYDSITWGSYVTNTSAGWTRNSQTFTVPSNREYGEWIVEVKTPANNEIHYVDALFIEEGSTANDYFDGDSTDTASFTYDWTGTAHQSSSKETTVAGTFEYAAPNDWRNILGPSHSLEIDRAAMDVGTLKATLFDAELDPAVSSDLAPGKQLRVRALVAGSYESVFEGRIDNANVTYERDEDVTTGLVIRTIIDLTAQDNMAGLANRGESRGMASVDDLPYILEGKGVPWNCNGSGDQVTSATTVSTNADASTADQIAITRDSVSGYAWVDRNNVLQAWDSASLGATANYFFTDTESALTNYTSYTHIDAGFNTENCINEVTVNWLRYNTTKGTTEEVAYGPYVDQSSIDTYGPRAATFTIHGATENATTIANFASAVLTANATPVRRASSITVPVRDEDEIAIATHVDLYDLVGVTFGTLIDSNYRVTGIKHNITPDLWTVTYEFDVQDSVAAPTWTPSPNTTPVGPAYLNRYRDSDRAIATSTWTTIAFGSTNEATGISTDGNGVMTVTQDGVYVINTHLVWGPNTSGERLSGIFINGTIKSRAESSPGIAGDFDMAVSGVHRLNAGDTVDIQVWQNSGSTISILGGEARCNVQVYRMGD